MISILPIKQIPSPCQQPRDLPHPGSFKWNIFCIKRRNWEKWRIKAAFIFSSFSECRECTGLHEFIMPDSICIVICYSLLWLCPNLSCSATAIKMASVGERWNQKEATRKTRWKGHHLGSVVGQGGDHLLAPFWIPLWSQLCYLALKCQVTHRGPLKLATECPEPPATLRWAGRSFQA